MAEPPQLSIFILLFLPLVFSLNQEGLFLHQIKLSFYDPLSTLSNWNPRDDTPCSWTGIRCNPSFSVFSIDLSSTNIAGSFPTLLCRLSNLTHISLSNNYINSTLPAQISTCQKLTFLDLSQNLLIGKIPNTLPLITTLLHLDLAGNNFSGEIPLSFANFRQLQVLSLVSNLLNETIPAFISNLTTLRQLNLSYNPFTPTPIPPEFGKLTGLEIMWLAGCNLVGQIPESLGNLKKLKNLDLSENFLHGSIPDTITGLSSIFQIELYNNQLSGKIPAGMGALKTLAKFDASMNMIEGTIPDDLCGLPNLESLNLYQNKLVGRVPDALGRLTRLYELKLFDNGLNGSLPSELGKGSPLVSLDVSNNFLSGEIPAGVCNGGALEELILINNSFSGSLPASLGACLSLSRVRLRDNGLSGKIPRTFWRLPHVYLLDLAGNSFSGEISPDISEAQNLSQLVISRNQFSGKIPTEIGNLRTLVEFSGDKNRLNGSLPASIGILPSLSVLNLGENQLSGELPTDFPAWTRLSELNLSSNQFSGPIPAKLGYLPALNYLDLSRNFLAGPVPIQLENLKLNEFNVSYNRLSGELPPLFSKPFYSASFLGNPDLCGDFIVSCSKSHRDIKDHGWVWLLRSIFILAGLVFAVGVVWFYFRYRNFTKSEKRKAFEKSKWVLTSFHKLGFSEYEILDSLDEDNLIGSGGSGKVYKAILSNGETVAVKKLWSTVKQEESQNDNGFEAEVATLGKIRHKNIVRLWCSCTNRDCKLLVYEYMPNGSLGDLLHSSKSGLLDWPTRYKIAVDAAEGLSYLHHDCVPPIVHRDVKSNNILLDAQFGARVADFGVAKILEVFEKGVNANSMSVIAGSYGYIAPEYAYTLRVNEKSDIYSFGVVILELVTGRHPIDPEFGEAKDLVKWVCATLEKKGIDHVLDPKLSICYKEEIGKVLDVGLICTNPLPINRPSMRRVVKMLLETSMEKSKSLKKDGKLSPYYYEDSSDQGSIL